jgi:acyl-CoA synthetase
MMGMTPSLWKLLGKDFHYFIMDYSNTNALSLLLGGESFPLDTFLYLNVDFPKYLNLFNIYGTTECSCWASMQKITSFNDTIHLGAPLDCTDFFLMKDSMTTVEMCNENDVGPLYIGHPKRTTLINDEIDGVPYRDTGDIVQVVGGKLIYRGRSDFRVKRFGQQIHPENIEGALQQIGYTCSVLMYEVQLVCCVLSGGEDYSHSIKTIREHIYNILGKKYIVDRIVFLDSLPLNKNGKIDRSELRFLLNAGKLLYDSDDDSITLEEYAMNLLKISAEGFDSSRSFVQLGGNSLEATFLLRIIFKRLGIKPNDDTMGRILNILLYEPFDNFLKLINDNSIEDQPDSVIFPVETVVNDKLAFGEISTILYPGGSGTCQSLRNLSVVSVESIYMEKCIDASPLVARYEHVGVVYIGSHSGLFGCYNIETCFTLWETRLPDRIESTACLSSDGNYVCVGCHDYCIYVLDARNGIILNVFETGAQVKAAPTYLDQMLKVIKELN